ncbi:rhodanese-like domain-containing protein [Deinococcus peraridilitoris]|nr:rhodanese-like domain-containing protein [Deinococcus peraridilitoris]
MEEVTPQEGQRRLQQGALLLDVRESEEFRDVHAQGAQLMPLSTFQENYATLDQDREIVVICRSGARSARAAQFLLDNGYKAVNLEGGTVAWEAQGLPVEKENA